MSGNRQPKLGYLDEPEMRDGNARVEPVQVLYVRKNPWRGPRLGQGLREVRQVWQRATQRTQLERMQVRHVRQCASQRTQLEWVQVLHVRRNP